MVADAVDYYSDFEAYDPDDCTDYTLFLPATVSDNVCLGDEDPLATVSAATPVRVARNVASGRGI